jgi:riboflavin synthase
MFTGIIKEVGKIINISGPGKSRILEVSCSSIISDIKKGDSISVNGCCLTVTGFTRNSFAADLSEITVSTTNFANAKINDCVNLENSLMPGERLGGHFVSGHIDGIAEIAGIKNSGSSYIFEIKPPASLSLLIAPKGSVCLDGISLTVAGVNDDIFTVSVIPHTFEFTNLKYKKSGDFLNIEADIIARYIANILKISGPGQLQQIQDGQTLENIRQKDEKLKEKLIEHGFFK